MEKRLLLLLICFAVVLSVNAQNMATVIKIQAMEMAKAVADKDLEKAATYMPPETLTALGGMEKVQSMSDTMSKYMQQFGAQIKRVTIGNPSEIVSFNKELQSIVPQTTEFKMLASTIVASTSLLAISRDNGKHWCFVDTSMLDSPKTKAGFPLISPALKIPPRARPIIKPDSAQ
jgi:hypothetical protein